MANRSSCHHENPALKQYIYIPICSGPPIRVFSPILRKCGKERSKRAAVLYICLAVTFLLEIDPIRSAVSIPGHRLSRSISLNTDVI